MMNPLMIAGIVLLLAAILATILIIDTNDASSMPAYCHSRASIANVTCYR